MSKRRPAPPLFPTMLLDLDPGLINKRARAIPTKKVQWLAAMADVTLAKDQLVKSLVILQGLQADYVAWYESQPAVLRKSARGKQLFKIVAMNLTVDVAHLDAAARIMPP